MGLGPPVCVACKVYASLDQEYVTTTGWGNWYCPLCGTREIGHLWEQKDQEVYDVNQKFVDFIKG